MKCVAWCLSLVVNLLPMSFVNAEVLRVAVASNALPMTKELARLFTAETGHELSLSAASTGKLYAQIVNGAPYDVFMAANVREPERLVNAGLAIAGSRQTYAIGRLVLYSTRMPLQGRSGKTVLMDQDWSKLAIANPRTAPYGRAAQQVLEHLKLWQSHQHKLVRGENISQAFYFAHSGNADLGLVALSQIKAQRNSRVGDYWSIPAAWYQPLHQQVVILKRSAHKDAAWQLLKFMKSNTASNILIDKYGYGVSHVE